MSLGNAGRIAACWFVIKNRKPSEAYKTKLIYLRRAVLTVGGVYAFVLSKRSVESRRYESLRVRERMRKANQGDYDSSKTDRRFDY
ncbi:hypothetical protein KR200_004288 [Drosophila serrata]|nr:hypothetical protein KR200_004288 [Drosophila serrata]